MAQVEVQEPDIMMEERGIWDIGMPTPLLPRDTVDYDYFSYESQGGNISAQTNYRMFTTDATGFYYLPSAMIQVAFTVTKSDGVTQVDLADNAALCANGWSLFEDARLRMNDQEVAMVQKPGKLCHIVNLVDKGLTWVQTVGKDYHYFVESVSDLATTGATGIASDRPAQYVAPIVASTLATDGSFQPRGMYDQVQLIKTAISGATGAVQLVQQNPNWDPAFQQRVNRAIFKPIGADGTVSTGAALQNIFLPLKDIFPLMELDRVVQGTKIEIELNKISQVAEAIFSGNTSNCLINIQRIRFWVARLRPSLSALARVEEQVAANPVVNHTYDNYKLYLQPYNNTAQGEQSFQIQHKQNKPTKVFIAFQYAVRSSNQLLNPLQFDLLGVRQTNTTGLTGMGPNQVSCNLQNVQLRHNGKPVPNLPYDPNTDYSRILYDLYRLGAKESEDSACITFDNWKNLYPIFGFDLSLLEGAPYEARSQSTLDMYWNVSNTINNTFIASQSYNVYAVVVSEGSAVVDFSSGITNVRTV